MKKPMAMMEDSLEYKKWENRRNRNTYASYFIIFLAGVEINSVIVTLLYYLVKNFNMTSDESRMYYSIAETFNALGQILSGLLIGRYIDKTRNLRLVILFNLLATIVGNLMYSLPFHISFVFVGRFLCGFNEAFQVTFCGEFKRCYKDDELIRVLSWYELCFAVGMTTGPGAPVVFSWVDIKLGRWPINKYNALHVFIILLTLILLLILWFELSDLSKELDFLKQKYSSNQQTMDSTSNNERKNEQSLATKMCLSARKDGRQKNDSDSIGNNTNDKDTDEQTPSLMKWKELFQIDIITLCASYSIVRYCSNAAASSIAMDAATLFEWPVGWFSWLTIAGGVSHFLIITTMIRCHVFKGLKRNFYCYISALNLSMFTLATLPLPIIVNIKPYYLQLLYLAIQILAKGWVYFHAQSAGKILLFNTVTPENSCLIDSIRSSVGSLARLFAFSTSFLCFKYPAHFFLPFGAVLFITTSVILYRYNAHMYKRSNSNIVTKCNMRNEMIIIKE